MRRAAYIAWARDQAAKMIAEETFAAIIKAIEASTEIALRYTNKEGVKKIYEKIQPIEFFITPKFYAGIKKIEAKINPVEPAEKPIEEKIEGTVYLWALNTVSGKKESFYAETIKAAYRMPNIIEACLDPSVFNYFWSQTLPLV